MNRKQFLRFYFINVTIALLSVLFIFWGLKGSVQERFAILSAGGKGALNLSVQTVVLLVLGYLASILLLKLARLESSEISNNRKSGFLILGYNLYFIGLFLLVAKKWAQDRFPMHTPEIVFYTLKYAKGNYDPSIIAEVVKIVLASFFTSFVLFLSVLIIELKEKTSYLYFSILKSKKLKINLNVLYLVFGLLVLLASCADLYKELKIPEYIKNIKIYNQPVVDSQFYMEEYVVPSEDKIVFPSKKKNLILIFVESMESSFADKENGGLFEKNVIPNLTKYANENINFSNTEKIGGGVDLSGTGWTVAGMTAKLAGLPFNLTGEENPDQKFFLPGATTLTDILSNQGYSQTFLFGSDKHFASRDALLETHGNVEVHDIDWYKKNKMLPNDYFVFWGFEDLKLFDFARSELENIDKSEPFMLGLLTVDTHMPSGYQCSRCPEDEDMPLKNAIKCSDALIGEFLDWCKNQDWYEDTVIALMGDHLFMATNETNPFGSSEYITAHRTKREMEGMSGNPRRWLNVFINSSVSADTDRIKNRSFSSFDIFPTILAAMGCEIEGNRLGFGVNLFSNEATLCERFDEEYINRELMSNNIQYRSFEFGR